MSINPQEYSRLTTAKILVKPDGSSEYKNLGTMESVSHDLKADRVDVTGAGKGFTYIRGKLPSKLTHMYQATATEATPEMVELSLLSSPATNVSQASATGLTATFTGTSLRTAYRLNKYGVTNVVVKNITNSVTYALGTDYDLDAGNGFLEIVKGGAITPGDTINVTFDCPAITRKGYTPNSKRTIKGEVVILFQDSHADDPIEVHAFYGQYFISQNANQSSSDVAKWTLEFYPLSRHTVTCRDLET